MITSVSLFVDSLVHASLGSRRCASAVSSSRAKIRQTPPGLPANHYVEVTCSYTALVKSARSFERPLDHDHDHDVLSIARPTRTHDSIRCQRPSTTISFRIDNGLASKMTRDPIPTTRHLQSKGTSKLSIEVPVLTTGSLRIVATTRFSPSIHLPAVVPVKPIPTTMRYNPIDH